MGAGALIRRWHRVCRARDTGAHEVCRQDPNMVQLPINRMPFYQHGVAFFERQATGRHIALR